MRSLMAVVVMSGFSSAMAEGVLTLTYYSKNGSSNPASYRYDLAELRDGKQITRMGATAQQICDAFKGGYGCENPNDIFNMLRANKYTPENASKQTVDKKFDKAKNRYVYISLWGNFPWNQ